MNEKIKLTVIGGGPGGYAAAFLAADLGMDVTLVDLDKNPGGVCLYRGCIPSKALLHVAKLIHEAEEAKNWGESTFRIIRHKHNLCSNCKRKDSVGRKLRLWKAAFYKSWKRSDGSI